MMLGACGSRGKPVGVCHTKPFHIDRGYQCIAERASMQWLVCLHIQGGYSIWRVHQKVCLSSTRLFTATIKIGRGVARRPTGCLLVNGHSSTLSIHSTLQRTPGPGELLRSGTHRGIGRLLASKPCCFRSRLPHVAFEPPILRSHTDK